eukprot:GFUD01009260.1.p1 GENE.GFUD01009260.1~~GFUD01009260.1.p1  ORF type:complete len:587 (+),score=157.90 GFUD01009260.1:101-1861(+)
MGKLSFILCCCELFSVLVKAQKEGVADEQVLETCEEALEYVEFLENSVKIEIEGIIHRSPNEAKKATNLSNIVATTLDKVMEIRNRILRRIRKIRKKEIKTCSKQNIQQEEMLSQLRMDVMSILLKLVMKDAASLENIRKINTDLLIIRASVNDEIMRILMLPQNRLQTVLTKDNCDACSKLENISDSIERILLCTENINIFQEDDKEDKQDCVDPTMYIMELIDINEFVDLEIKNLYTSINYNHSDETYLEDLIFYKPIRDRIDKLITALSNEKDSETMKKRITRSLAKVRSKLKRKIKDCQEKCSSRVCSSCAADVIYSAMERMENYRDLIKGQQDFEIAKDAMRKDLINYIDRITKECDKIFVKKVKFGSIDKCEQEKLEIHRLIKDPLWELVNITINRDKPEQVVVMVDDMMDQLDRYLVGYCDTGDLSVIDREPSCEIKEYGQTKEYVTKVDEIIEEHLFKISGDSDQLNVVLGFLKIQKMFDDRVRRLFEDKLVCPEETRTIKNEYMGKLNRCLEQFMDANMKMRDLSRAERISCVKDLRSSMEKRIQKIFQAELENSFKLIRPYIFSSSFDADATEFGI